MIKTIIGIVLGILIGMGCRFFGIPLPGPPAILGAILAVAMATGYTVTDKVMSRRAAAPSVGAVAGIARGERLRGDDPQKEAQP